MNVKDLLSLLCVPSPSSTAVLLPDSGISISYESLRQQVICLAESLAGTGIEPGSRIAIAMPNGFPAITILLAASIVGTAAPLNPAYRYREFCFYLQDLSARVLICPGDGAEEAERAAAKHGIPVLRVEMNHGTVQLIGVSARRSVPPVSPQNIAIVLHTSGSTGQPKRVPLTHANVAASCANIAEVYKLTPEDVSLCVMPVFHVHGLVGSTVATFFSGGKVVIPARFSPMMLWRLLENFHVTWYSAVPTLHQLLLTRTGKNGKRKAGSHLRFIRSCSAPLPPQLMENLENAFQVPVVEAYGMTEASHQICSNSLPPGRRRPGFVGQSAAISIMDEQGNHLPAGELGEVVIHGPNVIKAYENTQETNDASFVDGWLRTGDQGVRDQQGDLRLTGRIKELINRGGEKIAPREIDEVLLSHPAVAEAAAFGVPHPTWGEEVAVAVVLREPHSKAALLKYCRHRLAEFKCPTKIHITETIPKSSTGKIRRSAIAAAFAHEENRRAAGREPIISSTN